MGETNQSIETILSALVGSAALVQDLFDKQYLMDMEEFGVALRRLPEFLHAPALALTPARSRVGSMSISAKVRLAVDRSVGVAMTAQIVNLGYAVCFDQTNSKHTAITVQIDQVPLSRNPAKQLIHC